MRWSKESLSVISRMKSAAFEKSDVQKSSVHVLDLSPSGFIKPHVDSIKVNCYDVCATCSYADFLCFMTSWCLLVVLHMAVITQQKQALVSLRQWLYCH